MWSGDIDYIYVIFWEDAVEFQRNSTTIAAIAEKIGLSDADLDDLFRKAGQIVA